MLLASDADDSLLQSLAGFAVEYVSPDGATHPVRNRLSFSQPITSATTPQERTFPSTSEAPLQKFHRVHFPPDVQPGNYTYRATAMLFAPGSEDKLTRGPSTEVSVEVYHPNEKLALLWRSAEQLEETLDVQRWCPDLMLEIRRHVNSIHAG